MLELLLADIRKYLHITWLDENTDLSKEAKERISIVANWDKLGGATKT